MNIITKAFSFHCHYSEAVTLRMEKNPRQNNSEKAGKRYRDKDQQLLSVFLCFWSENDGILYRDIWMFNSECRINSKPNSNPWLILNGLGHLCTCTSFSIFLKSSLNGTNSIIWSIVVVQMDWLARWVQRSGPDYKFESDWWFRSDFTDLHTFTTVHHLDKYLSLYKHWRDGMLQQLNV